MLTKKDLEIKFNLGGNTVYRTLQVCPLDTKKKEYTEEEIEQYFAKARELLDAGKTYKEVEQFFGLNNPDGAEEVEAEEFNAEGFAANEADDAADSVTMATAETLAGMVEKSVEEIAPYIPALVTQAINQQMQEGGKIREAFNQMNEQILRGKRMSSGAQFLMNKLKSGKKPTQLTGTQEQNLLEASVSNSEEN